MRLRTYSWGATFKVHETRHFVKRSMNGKHVLIDIRPEDKQPVMVELTDAEAQQLADALLSRIRKPVAA